MIMGTLAVALLLVISGVNAAGPTCHKCTESASEEECMSQGTTDECNNNQICQTVVRCVSPTGIMIKKGCVGASNANNINGGPTCTDNTNTKCAVYCDSELCNAANYDEINSVLTCPVKDVGPLCRTCVEETDENVCDQGPLEQCNPNQVCQTSIRCIIGEDSQMKKGCVGAGPELNVVTCESADNTKCGMYCDGDACNDESASLIAAMLSCPVRAVGIHCRSCTDAPDEATCNQGPLEQCNPNQVCQISIRCTSGGDSLMKKGCVGTPTDTALDTPYCENADTSKCAYYCDSEACNDNTAQYLDTVIDCPTRGVGPICTVCDDVDNEGDCNTQNEPQTCRESEVCFAKVLCDRPNETARYKKRCLNIAAVADLSSLNNMVCENIDNCSLACDTDYCNTDTAELFQALNCPVRPPGIECQKCTDVYDESECEDIRCRAGNLCYTKVICERDSGLTRITKRCKRETVADPTMLDNPVCPKDTKCEMTCGEDGCNVDAQIVIDALACTVGPTPEPTEVEPPEPTTPPAVDLIPEGPDVTPGGSGDTCTETQGTGNCVCSCTCESDCPVTETPEPLPVQCTAGVVGPNTLTTFDGSSYPLSYNNKYITSSWLPESDEQCKFQLRLDTEDAPGGSTRLAWAGYSFGVHAKKSDKFERNYRISLKQGFVEIRGRGYSPTKLTESGCHHTDTGEHPWTFCINIDTPGTFIARGEVPALGCWHQVTFIEAATDESNDMAWIESGSFYDGELRGMCGDRDGDASNDAQQCPRDTGDVAADCVEGIHQGNA